MTIETSIIKDIVIPFTAVIGMGLGIYNLYTSRSKEKVRLKVIPKSVFTMEQSDAHIISPTRFSFESTTEYIAIEVLNLSNFPITISAAGFCTDNPDEFVTIANPVMPDKGKWPRRLESRESVTIYGNLESLTNAKIFNKLTQAYAETSCDYKEVGSSEALTKIVKSFNA